MSDSNFIVITYNISDEKVEAMAFFKTFEGAEKWLNFLKDKGTVIEERVTWAKYRKGIKVYTSEFKTL